MRKSLPATIVLFVLLMAACSPAALAQDAVRNGEIVKIDAAAKSFIVKTARGQTNIVTTGETVIKDGDKPLTFEDLKVERSFPLQRRAATCQILSPDERIWRQGRTSKKMPPC